jgi:hypothetical protein
LRDAARLAALAASALGCGARGDPKDRSVVVGIVDLVSETE